MFRNIINLGMLLIKPIQFSIGKRKMYFQGKEKSKLLQLFDLYSWIIKERRHNIMYYAFGLNIRGRDQKEYIGSREFIHLKNKVERRLKKNVGAIHLNYDVITKDKFYSTSFFEANNISCIKNLALLDNQFVIHRNGKCGTLEEIFGFHSPFILKNTILESQKGVFVCTIENNNIVIMNKRFSIAEFGRFLGRGKWVVQDFICPNKEIRRFNNSALNIARIVTIRRGETIEYLSGFQSFATGSKSIDNWGDDAIFVGIDISASCLKKYGFYHPCSSKGTITDSHPDSRIRFEGYRMPELNEAVELCKRAHRLLFFAFIIGWDVAMTDSGPMILEANETPGINAVQCLDGGLREKIINNAKITINRGNN